MTSTKINTVQVMRGLAALAVVLLHFRVYLSLVAPQFSQFLSYGYLGVDVFFVISGFIIYVSTSRPATRQASGFVLRRFCRVVLPAWVAMMLLVLVKPPYLRDLLYGILFVPLQNSEPPGYGYSFLIVAWTLSYELLFYLAFAGVLLLDLGRRHRGMLAGAVLVTLVFGVQSQLGCCTLDAMQAPLADVGLVFFPLQIISLMGNPMLLEFVVGMFFGWAYLEGWFTRSPRALKFLLLSLAIGFSTFLALQGVDGHGLARGGILAVLLVFAGLCLQVMLVRLGGLGRFNRFVAPLVVLGEISYSLYLVHPIIKAAMALPSFQSVLDPLGAYGKFVLAIAATLIFSNMFYRLVELPTQRLGRQLSHRFSPVAAPTNLNPE